MRKYTNIKLACGLEAGKWQFGRSEFGLIKNGIELSKFQYNKVIRDEYRKKYGLDDSIVYGHIGRFETPKNHCFLIEIFKEIANIQPAARLVLIGDGSLREKIQEKVANYGLQNKVMFLGMRSDVGQILQMLDVMIFPSLYEGVPLSCIEAQASGLPCLLSDRIDTETKIIDSCIVVNLKNSSNYWSKIALEACKKKREDTYYELKLAGFDIDEEAQKLQAMYLSMEAQ